MRTIIWLFVAAAVLALVFYVVQVRKERAQKALQQTPLPAAGGSTGGDTPTGSRGGAPQIKSEP